MSLDAVRWSWPSFSCWLAKSRDFWQLGASGCGVVNLTGGQLTEVAAAAAKHPTKIMGPARGIGDGLADWLSPMTRAQRQHVWSALAPCERLPE